MLEKNIYGFGNQESLASGTAKNSNDMFYEETIDDIRTVQPYIPYVMEEETYLPVVFSVPEKPSRQNKKTMSMRFAAVLVAVCMISSALFGFGGTYLANHINGTNIVYLFADTDEDNSTGTAPYQSIIQTSSVIALTEKMSIEETVGNVKDSVVEIITETVSTGGRMGQFVSEGAGSGVIVSKDGYIITNHHVISGARTIQVRLDDGKTYNADLIGTDVKTDLAVIKIDADNLQPAVMGNTANIFVGQTAIAIGNPLGELGGTVTSGIISALDREIIIDGEAMSLLQTDAAINPGNSGGGLFNLYGELVGVVNAKSSGSGIEGLGFAIPVDTVKNVFEEIIEHGYVRGRIDTGFTLIDIQDSRTAMSYRVSQTGLYISRSVNDEFQSGDRITAVDGKQVSSLAEFNQQINKFKVGDKVDITVSRSGRNIVIPLALTELTK